MTLSQERIAVDPAILVGKPVIKGTRLAVEFLLDLMAEGWTAEQILGNYPQLTADDLQAALHYATDDGLQLGRPILPLVRSESSGEVR